MSSSEPQQASRAHNATPPQRYRFGFDIGGTFTDFVLIDAQSGRIASYKTLTTPHHPAKAVIEGWRFLLESAVAVDFKKGGLLRITTPNHVSPPRGVLKWMITPRLARR